MEAGLEDQETGLAPEVQVADRVKIKRGCSSVFSGRVGIVVKRFETRLNDSSAYKISVILEGDEQPMAFTADELEVL